MFWHLLYAKWVKSNGEYQGTKFYVLYLPEMPYKQQKENEPTVLKLS